MGVVSAMQDDAVLAPRGAAVRSMGVCATASPDRGVADGVQAASRGHPACARRRITSAVIVTSPIPAPWRADVLEDTGLFAALVFRQLRPGSASPNRSAHLT